MCTSGGMRYPVNKSKMEEQVEHFVAEINDLFIPKMWWEELQYVVQDLISACDNNTVSGRAQMITLLNVQKAMELIARRKGE
jgi:hypothetical protein